MRDIVRERSIDEMSGHWLTPLTRPTNVAAICIPERSGTYGAVALYSEICPFEGSYVIKTEYMSDEVIPSRTRMDY